MKSLSLPSWLKSVYCRSKFSGESKGLGINMTGGGRIHFNEFISYSLGAGIGGVDQDLSFLFNDTPFEEDDFVMSYQIFPI